MGRTTELSFDTVYFRSISRNPAYFYAELIFPTPRNFFYVGDSFAAALNGYGYCRLSEYVFRRNFSFSLEADCHSYLKNRLNVGYFPNSKRTPSTAEQDASRALETIEAFAKERGLIICSYYIENESGSRLDRPELFRLLRDCQQNDILLIEDVDRLSRLSGEDWNTLKKMIRQKDIRVMAVNVPTTWINSGMSEFDSRLFAAINDMLLDMLAAVARRDYEQRRERQKQQLC